jgi:hypothetical protein
MNNYIINSPTDGTSALQLAPQITRNIKGCHVTIRFSSVPNYKVIEIVKQMLTTSYVDMLKKRVNEELHTEIEIDKSICA